MSVGEEVFQEAVDHFKKSKKSLRCSQVTKSLTELGFDVRDGRRGGHKIFVHDHLSGFTSSSYNCGHGKNPEIKPQYIVNIVKVLEENSDGLVVFLDDKYED